MQVDNGFLRGDAKQGVNEGTLTEYIAFRQPAGIVLCGSCASPRNCAWRIVPFRANLAIHHAYHTSELLSDWPECR